ncbi:MAG TPA: protein kinase [Polyangiales bacterium]
MPRPAPPSAARLGPYELVRPLGAGGMAETFVALRRGPAGFEQRVCLKRILPGFAAEPSFIEQFLDEAQLLAQMNCAQIVQVFDFGEFAGTYYMALELVEGADLETLLHACSTAGQRLPREIALFITAQLLSALDYAHSLRSGGQPLHIVHRDISPSNVLLNRRGEVKLADFGIAKSNRRSHRTRPGRGKGKLAYLCPEQVTGDAQDARGDLFSLGIVLYEMLAGKHPFMDESEHALLENILTGRRRPLSDHGPDFPSEVVQFVDRLLEVDPAERPDSARAALEQLPSSAPPFALQRRLAELVIQCASDLSGEPGPEADESNQRAATTQPILAQTPAHDFESFTPTPGAVRAPRPLARRPGLWLGGALVAAAVAASWHGARNPDTREPTLAAPRADPRPALNLVEAPPPAEETRPSLAQEATGSGVDAAAPVPASPLPAQAKRSNPLRAVVPAAPASEPALPSGSNAARGRSGVALRVDEF